MRALYIGGQKKQKNSGSWFKICFYLFIFLILIGMALNVAAPTLVEKWINHQGSGKNGYAFSTRDVDFSIRKGELSLKDVKVFNPQTMNKLLEAPSFTLRLSWADFFLYQDRSITVSAERVDVLLSKDLTSEVERVKSMNKSLDLYLDKIDGKISQLNIIEQKENMSRTVFELNEVNLKVKDVTPLSINKKTEFSLSSKVANGGKLQLIGKTNIEGGKTLWTITGKLNEVPSDILNTIAGDTLPFSFNESKINVEITAQSNGGKINGEIIPDVKRLNLIDSRPGIPTQTTARALTEELTFTLPFTLKDEFTVQYETTFQKLKSYRKYPEALTTRVEDKKKAASFWPF